LKFAIFFITVLSVLFLSGCAPQGNAPSRDNPRTAGETYDTQFPLSAMEYQLLLDKEIGLVLHEASMHIANARNVEAGVYPVSDEIANLDHTLNLTDEAIVSITNAYPAKTYEDDRLDTLRLLENVKETFLAYKKTLLGESDYEIEDIRKLLKSDFVALSGRFNVLHE
jgi:hypothetical protein